MFQYKVNRFLLYQSNFDYFTASVYSSSVTSPKPFRTVFRLPSGDSDMCKTAVGCSTMPVDGIGRNIYHIARFADVGPVCLFPGNSRLLQYKAGFVLLRGNASCCGYRGEGYIINVTILFRLCGKHLQSRHRR